MKRAFWIAALFLVTQALAAATRPTAEQQAIEWLFSEIQRSGAVFIRNGVEYNGEKAAAHLKSKLFWAGKRVQTARDFIAGIATKSETSGKPYEIRTKDGVQEPLESWLKARLAIFEKKRPAER